MSQATVLRLCESLMPGDKLTAFLASLGPEVRTERQHEVVAGEADEWICLLDHGVLVFEGPEGAIRRVLYTRSFAGSVHGVHVGMAADAVVALLGEPHKPWPMPHPNLVLMYDVPHFLRIDIDRQTMTVIEMIR